MAYTPLDSVQRPADGAVATTAWGDAVNDDVAYLYTQQNTNTTSIATVTASAASAQSTANTAVTNASNAATAAVAAQSTANTAVTDATTAAAAAASAQSTANTAVTNAATAQGTANTAVTNAATAQGTANNAATTANAAQVRGASINIGTNSLTCGTTYVSGTVFADTLCITNEQLYIQNSLFEIITYGYTGTTYTQCIDFSINNNSPGQTKIHTTPNLSTGTGTEMVFTSANTLAQLTSLTAHKTGIRTLDDSENPLMKLAPKKFFWNSETAGDVHDHEDVGFIVEDMLQVAPDLVTKDGSGNATSYSTRSLLAYTVAALQASNKRIDVLEAQVAQLLRASSAD
jgi:hypothetical protein